MYIASITHDLKTILGFFLTCFVHFFSPPLAGKFHECKNLTCFSLSSPQYLDAPNVFVEYIQEWKTYGKNDQCCASVQFSRSVVYNSL